MVRTVLRQLLAVVVVVLPASAWAQLGGGGREVDLRPRFVQGQQTRFKMEMTNTSEPVHGAGSAPTTKGPTGSTPRKPGGAAQPASDQSQSKVEMVLSLKVQSVSAGHEATVALVFDSLKMSTTNQDQKVEFDSTKPPTTDEDLVGALLRPLVGSTMTLKVDPAGNITSITGGEAFSGLGQFVGGGQGGDLFGPLFSAKKGTGRVHVGESWEDEDTIDNSLLGRFKMLTRHTLRSAAANEAKVDMTGHIVPGSEAPGVGAGQIKDSSFTGSYAWDTERGMLKRMDSTMKVRMEQATENGRTETRNESVVRVTQVK